VDTASGQVFIYAGGTFDEGLQIEALTFVGHRCEEGRYLTPILFEEISDDVFAVRGVGIARTVGLSRPTVYRLLGETA